MERHIFFLTSMLAISFFLITLPKSLCQENYSACNRLFNCGTITNIGYPFWSQTQNRPSYCGRDDFELYCQDNQNTYIQIGSQKFRVLNIDPHAYSMRMERTDLVYDNCSSNFTNTSLSTQLNLFSYMPNVENITLFYNCTDLSIGRNNFTCHTQTQTDQYVFYGYEDSLLSEFPDLDKCKGSIKVPISRDHPPGPEGGIEALLAALRYGFEVHYSMNYSSLCTKCAESKGICGSGLPDNSPFTCYCQDGPHASDCNDNKKKWSLKWKIVVGVVASTISVILTTIACYFYQRRKKNSYAKSYIQSRATSSDSSLMDPEKGSKNFGVHLFTYSELEEATNYFDSDKELGDGGFGTVYFGKLRDGRCVAVKRLYENNYKRVEQFINEVEILTRLRHQNLVSLYGCTSRRSHELLLVYEYIPNGTVADHLHGERAKPGTLPWHIRMSIATETASALAYLHASDIIHRDVKTNNILLDNHFVVKVADFGLSRLFPNDVTHVSTAPQGTPGYVDPEYHECYQLTNKSDVYSFGVVLIELISSMPAVDITRHRHEINLSTMAINKIQNRALHELVDPTLGFESDYKVRKMINAVAELAFQCLQSMKDMRPSMQEVADALKDIESDGKHKSKPEVMDISADDVVLLKNGIPPPSPDSNLASNSTTPNASQ